MYHCINVLILKLFNLFNSFQWSINFLADNEEIDVYFYLITVHTGIRKGSGTTSNVNCNLVGENNESGLRVLSDGINQVSETQMDRQTSRQTYTTYCIITDHRPVNIMNILLGDL